MPKEHLRITLEITGETTRALKIEARGEKYAGIINALASRSLGSSLPSS
jgi:hypothetical protein